jgi:MSHA biogenesis protein MshP
MSKPTMPLHIFPRPRHAQRGLGAIMAIVVVVVLASLSAAVMRLTWSQSYASTQDLQGARALQAASAGIEWGMYKALKGTWATTGCSGSSQTLDLSASMGFRVTVACAARPAFSEAGTAIWLYTVTATACNSTAACPDNTAAVTLNYVERSRQAMATNVALDE